MLLYYCEQYFLGICVKGDSNTYSYLKFEEFLLVYEN